MNSETHATHEDFMNSSCATLSAFPGQWDTVNLFLGSGVQSSVNGHKCSSSSVIEYQDCPSE